MEEIIFLVEGSSDNPYKVRFVRRGEKKFSAYCNCAAGENGMCCKHRVQILCGDKRNIVSNNQNQVDIVAGWLPGTDIQAALNAEKSAENNLESAKKSLATAKKILAKAMLD